MLERSPTYAHASRWEILGNSRPTAGCQPSHPRASHGWAALLTKTANEALHSGYSGRRYGPGHVRLRRLGTPTRGCRATSPPFVDARSTSTIGSMERCCGHGPPSARTISLFLHVLHAQVLHAHHLVFADEAGGQFVQEIVPTVGDFLMKLGHSSPHLRSRVEVGVFSARDDKTVIDWSVNDSRLALLEAGGFFRNDMKCLRDFLQCFRQIR